MKKIVLLLIILISVTKITAQEKNNAIDTVRTANFNLQEINNFWGKELADNGDFYKVTFPRTDISLHIDKVDVAPALAYTSWIAYLPMKEGTHIMGDMVLLDTEIPKVIPFFKEKGIKITAIHNHLLREEPRLVYMHFAGNGDAIKLSEIMKEAFSFTSTPVENPNVKDAKKINFNWKVVKNVLGENSESGNLLKYSFPRKENIQMNGHTLPITFGIATAIGFQALNENEVAITGDFVMLEEEVNDVIAALAKNDIGVTALHNHMLSEEPRLFYMHFWAVGKGEDLAKGFKEALEKTNSTTK